MPSDQAPCPLSAQHTPSAEFQTNNQVQDPGYYRYVMPSMGAREKLLEERAMAMAAMEMQNEVAPPLPPRYESTHRQDFDSKPLPPGETLGRKARGRRSALTFTRPEPPRTPPGSGLREGGGGVGGGLSRNACVCVVAARQVMMTQNMIDIKGAGDGLFRKEHDMVARHQVMPTARIRGRPADVQGRGGGKGARGKRRESREVAHSRDVCDAHAHWRERLPKHARAP